MAAYQDGSSSVWNRGRGVSFSFSLEGVTFLLCVDTVKTGDFLGRLRSDIMVLDDVTLKVSGFLELDFPTL